MAVNIGAVQKLTSPNPFALVSTKKPDGTTNLMALSWWTYVSNHPAAIAVCVSKKGYTGELIRENEEFGLNIVDESLKEAAFACGTCSGRAENKPEKFGIELMDGTTMETKLVKAHRVALECALANAVEVSDHFIYIAEVTEAHSNPDKQQLFAMNGYAVLGTI
jgi:flavin reductase (DIM6/NTAB) family NADH-FMN oxidoreductase RutF